MSASKCHNRLSTGVTADEEGNPASLERVIKGDAKLQHNTSNDNNAFDKNGISINDLNSNDCTTINSDQTTNHHNNHQYEQESTSSISSTTAVTNTPLCSSSSSSNKPNPKFHLKQRVYARDEPTGLLYEAIIRKTMYGPKSTQVNVHLLPTSDDDDDSDSEKLMDMLMEEQRLEGEHIWHYFVHYQGWNVRWDRWVEEDYLYEDNDGTRVLAGQLKEEVRRIKALAGKTGNKREKEVLLIQQNMRKLEKMRRDEEEREKSCKGKGKELKGDGYNEEENEKEVGKQNENCDGSSKKKKEEITDIKSSNESNRKNKKKSKQLTKAAIERERKLRTRDLQGRRKQSHAEKINLPFTLKKVLTDEWEVISQCGMVHKLPATVTVKDALDAYFDSKREFLMRGDFSSCHSEDDKIADEKKDESHSNIITDVENRDSTIVETNARIDDQKGQQQQNDENSLKLQEWKEMVKGIALYFDQALPVQLLYRQERAQYSVLESCSNIDVISASSDDDDQLSLHQNVKHKRWCEIYGCEYLLRLFVRFPELLAESNISDSDSSKILFKIGDFVRFLQKYQDKYLLQSYRRQNENEIDMAKKILKKQVAVEKKLGTGSHAEDVPTAPVFGSNEHGEIEDENKETTSKRGKKSEEKKGTGKRKGKVKAKSPKGKEVPDISNKQKEPSTYDTKGKRKSVSKTNSLRREIAGRKKKKY